MTGCEQREIKFRAWHKKKNKMYKVYRMCFADYQEGVFYYSKPYADGRSINAETGDQDIIIMQFTGLKDKNGKEVWEGDIVHVDRMDSFKSYNQAIIVYEDHRGSFLLQYTKRTNPKGILSMESITSVDGTVIFDNCTGWDIEVIGNVYENPELLEQSGERTNP